MSALWIFILATIGVAILWFGRKFKFRHQSAPTPAPGQPPATAAPVIRPEHKDPANIRLLEIYGGINMVLFVIIVVTVIVYYASDQATRGLVNWWGWSIFILQSLYLVLSFNTIDKDSKAAVICLGRPLYEKGPGYVFVPWLICSLYKVQRAVEQVSFPGDAEKIDKSGNDTTGVALGKVLPMRITTGTKELAEALHAGHPAFKGLDELHTRVTTEVIVSVPFQITRLLNLIRNIGSLEKVIDRMREIVETTLRAEFGTRTPALILADIEAINGKLKEKLTKLVGDDTNTINNDEDWGITLGMPQLVDVDLGKTINTALAKAAAAVTDKRTAITTAEGKKEARKLEGEGEKDYLTNVGEGNKKLAEAANVPGGEWALATQAMKEVASKAQGLFISGPNDLYGMVAAMQTVLSKTRKTVEVSEGGGV